MKRSRAINPRQDNNYSRNAGTRLLRDRVRAGEAQVEECLIVSKRVMVTAAVTKRLCPGAAD